MIKVKRLRTADCVVGGFRYQAGGGEVGSLLLGLYDAQGLLNHVGFTTTIGKGERLALTRRLEALREAPGFTGDAPGGPSRWSTARSGSGSPCVRSWWSRSATTIRAACAFATGRVCCAGGRTRRPANAPSSRSSGSRCLKPGRKPAPGRRRLRRLGRRAGGEAREAQGVPGPARILGHDRRRAQSGGGPARLGCPSGPLRRRRGPTDDRRDGDPGRARPPRDAPEATGWFRRPLRTQSRRSAGDPGREEDSACGRPPPGRSRRPGRRPTAGFWTTQNQRCANWTTPARRRGGSSSGAKPTWTRRRPGPRRTTLRAAKRLRRPSSWPDKPTGEAGGDA